MCEFVGAGLKPARYGNRIAMPDVETNNDLARAGFKPAPTEKWSESLTVKLKVPFKPAVRRMSKLKVPTQSVGTRIIISYCCDKKYNLTAIAQWL